MRVYLDANVLIRLIEGTDAVALTLVTLFDRGIDNPRLVLTTSDLSLAEVLVRPLRQVFDNDPASRSGEPVEASGLIGLYHGLFQSGTVTVMPIDQSILIRSAELRAMQKSIKLPDAIHLASAFASGCDCLLTGDAALGKAAERFDLAHIPLTEEALALLMAETP